jgi:hypothetical protein
MLRRAGATWRNAEDLDGLLRSVIPNVDYAPLFDSTTRQLGGARGLARGHNTACSPPDFPYTGIQILFTEYSIEIMPAKARTNPVHPAVCLKR